MMKHKREAIDKRIPRYRNLLLPTFLALKNLGGSGNNDEIVNQIILDLHISDEVADLPHKGNPNKTELSYQCDWARTYLKKAGIIENSARSVWSITPNYASLDSFDEEKVFRETNLLFNSTNHDAPHNDTDSPAYTKPENDNPLDDASEYPDGDKPWQIHLANILQNMDPYGFERLTQRVLRECGFTSVEVTKKSGDGGIDGTGKLKINGIFSFNVAFQCKRYKGVVGAPEVRDFRGSL